MDIIIAILGSGALSALISGVFTLVKDKKNSTANLTEGVQIVLYDRIKWIGRKYLAEGRVSLEDYEDLCKMHKVYHDSLHGNGFLDNLMDEVGKLPKG